MPTEDSLGYINEALYLIAIDFALFADGSGLLFECRLLFLLFGGKCLDLGFNCIALGLCLFADLFVLGCELFPYICHFGLDILDICLRSLNKLIGLCLCGFLCLVLVFMCTIGLQ